MANQYIDYFERLHKLDQQERELIENRRVLFDEIRVAMIEFNRTLYKCTAELQNMKTLRELGKRLEDTFTLTYEECGKLLSEIQTEQERMRFEFYGDKCEQPGTD